MVNRCWICALFIWNTNDMFCIFKWWDRMEGKKVEWDMIVIDGDWHVATRLWSVSCLELVASPRQDLALSRCQAWVAFWQAFVCVCHVRLGWNRSWTHTHIMTLTQRHQERMKPRLCSWQTHPLSCRSSSMDFSPPPVFFFLKSFT